MTLTLHEMQFFRAPDDAIAVSFLAWWRKWTRAILSGDAMHVPCGDCDECCRVEVELHPELGDRADGLDVFRNERGLDEIRRRDDGTCVHLENGRCSVYARRPFACRTFDCRTALAARTIILELGTDELTHVCEAAYRKFRIVAKTPADRDAMIAVQQALERAKTAIDPETWGARTAYAVIVFALLQWGGPLPAGDVARMRRAFEKRKDDWRAAQAAKETP